MYSTAVATAMRRAGIDARTPYELGLAGQTDPDLLAGAVAGGYTLLTENVADFAHLSAEHLAEGRHHPGVLVALSSRFSRRPAGIPALVAMVRAVGRIPLEDRLVYLERA